MHGRAAKAASEIARVNAFFPVMPLLGNRLARSRPFEGLTVGVSAHLTSYIGALLQELALVEEDPALEKLPLLHVFQQQPRLGEVVAQLLHEQERLHALVPPERPQARHVRLLHGPERVVRVVVGLGRLRPVAGSARRRRAREAEGKQRHE